MYLVESRLGVIEARIPLSHMTPPQNTYETTPEALAEHLSSFMEHPRVGKPESTAQHFSNTPENATIIRDTDTAVEIAITPPTDTAPGTIQIALELLHTADDPQFTHNGRQEAFDIVTALAKSGIEATSTNTGDWYTVCLKPIEFNNNVELTRLYRTLLHHTLTLYRLFGALHKATSRPQEVPAQPELQTPIDTTTNPYIFPKSISVTRTRPDSTHIVVEQQEKDKWTRYSVAKSDPDGVTRQSPTPFKTKREAFTEAAKLATNTGLPIYIK